MSDLFWVAVVSGICTALPLVLGQVLNFISTSRKINSIKDTVEASGQQRTEQIAAVQKAVNETKKTTVDLQADQQELARVVAATNTYNMAEIEKMIAKHVSGFGKLQ